MNLIVTDPELGRNYPCTSELTCTIEISGDCTNGCAANYHCPTSQHCDSCTIFCYSAEVCRRSTFYSYQCSNVVITAEPNADSVLKESIIYAPNGGNIEVNINGGDDAFGGGTIISKRTNNIIVNIDYGGNGLSDDDSSALNMTINATNLNGNVNINCKQHCSGAVILCPDNSNLDKNCILNCTYIDDGRSGSECENIEMHAIGGTPDGGEIICSKNDGDNCKGSKIFCESDGKPASCSMMSSDDDDDDVYEWVCVDDPSPSSGTCSNRGDNLTPRPTGKPVSSPTQVPSKGPTIIPSINPSSIPTIGPSSGPTIDPSINPSINPTSTPTAIPSHTPSGNPSSIPSSNPSSNPSDIPTHLPTNLPTELPTNLPSKIPSAIPSGIPSSKPSMDPTNIPTKIPTKIPSNQPSSLPTVKPSENPSDILSDTPSNIRTDIPSNNPSSIPSVMPSFDSIETSSMIPTMTPTNSTKKGSPPTLSPNDSPRPGGNAEPSSQPTLSISSSTNSPVDQTSNIPTSEPIDVLSSTSSTILSTTMSSTASSTNVSTNIPTYTITDPSTTEILTSTTGTNIPSSQPSTIRDSPTNAPSTAPSNAPSDTPTMAPFHPTNHITSQPSTEKIFTTTETPQTIAQTMTTTDLAETDTIDTTQTPGTTMSPHATSTTSHGTNTHTINNPIISQTISSETSTSTSLTYIQTIFNNNQTNAFISESDKDSNDRLLGMDRTAALALFVLLGCFTAFLSCCICVFGIVKRKKKKKGKEIYEANKNYTVNLGVIPMERVLPASPSSAMTGGFEKKMFAGTIDFSDYVDGEGLEEERGDDEGEGVNLIENDKNNQNNINGNDQRTVEGFDFDNVVTGGGNRRKSNNHQNENGKNGVVNTNDSVIMEQLDVMVGIKDKGGDKSEDMMEDINTIDVMNEKENDDILISDDDGVNDMDVMNGIDVDVETNGNEKRQMFSNDLKDINKGFEMIEDDIFADMDNEQNGIITNDNQTKGFDDDNIETNGFIGDVNDVEVDNDMDGTLDIMDGIDNVETNENDNKEMFMNDLKDVGKGFEIIEDDIMADMDNEQNGIITDGNQTKGFDDAFVD